MDQRYRFGAFELDRSKRHLLMGGEEMQLQPRVFDLLLYLVEHRDRVVSKDELVAEVWEGAFIADGAVQRAVSLARAALRRGGLDEAIRTYPRQGYRFCAEVEQEPAEQPGVPAARSGLTPEEREEELLRLQEMDASGGLGGSQLERWARLEEDLGRSHRSVVPLERAVAAFASGGDCRGAARCAIRLSNILLERREAAVAQGWLQRATRYLAGEGECRESGLLSWLSCRHALFAGDVESAREHAERSLEVGRRLEDVDLEALGLVYLGFTLLALGETERGPALLDEAGAAILAGGSDPWVAGFVFCGIIWGCINWGDLSRAGEWTDQFARWCATAGVAGYPGLCRLHRAEVLTLQGELAAAEEEATDARRLLAESLPWAEGDAHRVLGEIHLARGELEAAEEAFRRAHELGWDPQPGYALLRVAQGRGEAALKGLERALADRGWLRQRRGPLLSRLALVATSAGDLERARQALAELAEHPELLKPPAVAAMAARARGELELAEGRLREAARELREAARLWHEVYSPSNAATVHLRLAHCLAADGDPDGAELERSAAESIFERLDLPGLAAQCRGLRGKLGDATGEGSA